MMSQRKFRLFGVIVWAALCAPAFAAEETIDDFSSATNTAFISGAQVQDATVDLTGTTATDNGLAGVLGGSRQLTVELESSMFFQPVTAGVNVGAGLLQYSEDAGADGKATLFYGNIPKGLDFAQGINVVVNADASAATGYSLTLILQDSQGSTAVTQNSTQTGMGIPFSFSFSSFPTINPSDLVSIAIVVDGGGSQDLQLEVAATFGTPPRETLEFCQDGMDNDNDGLIDCLDSDCLAADPCGAPAPALSPLGLGMSVLMLLGAGLLAMVRMRRSI